MADCKHGIRRDWCQACKAPVTDLNASVSNVIRLRRHSGESRARRYAAKVAYLFGSAPRPAVAVVTAIHAERWVPRS
jgi:hypothetical protein